MRALLCGGPASPVPLHKQPLLAVIRGLRPCTVEAHSPSAPPPPAPTQDPPFGIHLCGPPELCVLPDGPVAAVHDERVRPYRPIPIFRPDTLVQHYLRPEEMRPFYKQVGYLPNLLLVSPKMGLF